MLPRFRNILIPVDFTKKNRTALDIVFEVAVDNHATVSLLHVIESIDVGDDQPDPEVEEFYGRLTDRAAAELDAMSQRFREAGIDVQAKTRFGQRAVEIVRYAREHNTDLIVMRSHALDPSQPDRNAVTLSYQVSLMCPCPILLVK